MEAILSSVATIATSLFAIAGQTVTFITSNPLMLVFFSIAIVGSGIGIFQRLRG